VNCGPRGLPFDRNLLYRNNGDGTFSDVSETSGISAPEHHYSLGVLTGDFNGDGRVDIYVACDQTPSLLYVNRGNGTFQEEALLRGVALDEHGKALSGMGVTAADYDGNGWPDLFRTNFSDERETLYRNRADGNFDDATEFAGLAHNTRFVGWGCGFFDFDNDGWKDLFLVNGHVYPEVDRLGLDIRFREQPILYKNLESGKFADISGQAGQVFQERHVSRGAAIGDIDNDGTLELIVNHQNEIPGLWKQAHRTANSWILLSLIGKAPNTSAVGARVRLVAGGQSFIDEVRSGGSYLSQGDFRLHFGLRQAQTVERIEIEWPDGCKQIKRDLPANRIWKIQQECQEQNRNPGFKKGRS
jgi:hypothetical protein